MKLLCNNNEFKLIYNGDSLSKLLYNFVEPDFPSSGDTGRFEPIGENEYISLMNSINSSDVSKYLGNEATSVVEENNGIKFQFGGARDYWYKLNLNLEPNTNYKITVNVTTDLASGIRIIGARLGNETAKYECSLGFLYTNKLVDNIGTIEFTTPDVLENTNGIYLGCLGNSASNPYLTINEIRIEKIIYKNLDHMNWLTIGDSITAGVGTTKTYREFICEQTGLIDNGNSRISGGSISLIGDGTLTGSGFTYMPNFISYVAKEKYVRPLLITIWLGTNDHIGNAPIGSEDSTDVTEFWGSLNNFLPKLKEAYPNAYIIYFTPAKKRSMGVNEVGHTLLDYINVIKKACIKYDIKWYDLYKDTYDQLDIDNMTADGLHFNITGHETVIAPYILSKIKEYVLNE